MRGPLPLFLRVVGVFDLQPPDACVVGIRETLRYDTFEIVGTHHFEEFAPPARDGERLGNDRRPLRNNALEVLSTLGERQSAQVGAVEPEDIESHVTGAPDQTEEQHDKCQTISQPGSYKLVNNLTFKGPPGGICLSITASFDLAGFAITNAHPDDPGNPSGTAGIFAADDHGRGITVRNGSIPPGFSNGVSLAGDSSIVEGLRVSGPGTLGIAATGIVRGNT